MAIAISDDHRELQRVARSFLERHDARRAARDLLDAPGEVLPPFWDELVGLGWLGLHLPEEPATPSPADPPAASAQAFSGGN